VVDAGKEALGEQEQHESQQEMQQGVEENAVSMNGMGVFHDLSMRVQRYKVFWYSIFYSYLCKFFCACACAYC